MAGVSGRLCRCPFRLARWASTSAAEPAAPPPSTIPPPAIIVPTEPMYLSFSGGQSDVLRGLGLHKVAPGAEIGSGLWGREVECPPKTLAEARRRRLPAPFRWDFEGPPPPLDVKEYTEEMLELHADTHSPAEVLLLMLRSYPHIHVVGDAAALFILKYHELAEENGRAGKKSDYFASKVYPLFVYLTRLADTTIGPQPLRAMELYLEHAVARAEVSQNYANYFIQNLKTTQETALELIKLDHKLARGSFKDALHAFNDDDELDLRVFTFLTHHCPNFFNVFPRQTAGKRDEFLEAMRTNEAIYVLHPSYLLQISDKEQTALAKAKQLVSLLESDDDNETLLIPYVTFHELLLASVDARDGDDLSLAIAYLAEKCSRRDSKVRFVWPSETISPLASYRRHNASLDNADDRILTFCTWLDRKLPPLTEHTLREHDEELEASELRLFRAYMTGYNKSKVHQLLTGGPKAIRGVIKKTDELPQEPQQGVVLLCTDADIQKHSRAIGLWCEPAGDVHRQLNEQRQHKKTQWYRFTDGLSSGERASRRAAQQGSRAPKPRARTGPVRQQQAPGPRPKWRRKPPPAAAGGNRAKRPQRASPFRWKRKAKPSSSSRPLVSAKKRDPQATWKPQAPASDSTGPAMDSV
ncbi:hypothetical protein DIPPA_02531 [Diplonema papillatum]|nr:hypothetical protein DIPPA_02531 [Diplonema papillatum]